MANESLSYEDINNLVKDIMEGSNGNKGVVEETKDKSEYSLMKNLQDNMRLQTDLLKVDIVKNLSDVYDSFDFYALKDNDLLVSINNSGTTYTGTDNYKYSFNRMILMLITDIGTKLENNKKCISNFISDISKVKYKSLYNNVFNEVKGEIDIDITTIKTNIKNYYDTQIFDKGDSVSINSLIGSNIESICTKIKTKCAEYFKNLNDVAINNGTSEFTTEDSYKNYITSEINQFDYSTIKDNIIHYYKTQIDTKITDTKERIAIVLGKSNITEKDSTQGTAATKLKRVISLDTVQNYYDEIIDQCVEKAYSDTRISNLIGTTNISIFKNNCKTVIKLNENVKNGIKNYYNDIESKINTSLYKLFQ